MSVRLVRTTPLKPPLRRQLFLNEPGASMGEVRVTVTLTNAYDAMLADEGRLPEEKVRSCEVEAMVDCENFRVVPNPAHPNGPAFRV